MNEQITIPTIEEAETFRIGSSAETLAQTKTAERLAEKVAEALALTHDGHADGVYWQGLAELDTDYHLDGIRLVWMKQLGDDRIEFFTPGGPLESVWVSTRQEDWDYGVSFALAVLTILRNPEQTKEALLLNLNIAADRDAPRRPGEDPIAFALRRREGKEFQAIRGAEELIRTRWHDVAEVADELSHSQV